MRPTDTIRSLLMMVFLAHRLSCTVCANPFADSVVSYAPRPGQFVGNPMYNDPARCLGAPKGLLVSIPDNSSLATLGDGGSIVLAFNDPVYDDPRNPYGLDFIAFSNAQFVGGNPNYRWQELAYVEISQDCAEWHLILPNILPGELRGGIDTGNSYTVVRGYAEYTPTVGLPQVINPASGICRTNEELYTVPDRASVQSDPDSIGFDYASGGGDAFDIAWAVAQSAPGVPARDEFGNAIPANLGWFRYIRITDAVVGDSLPELGEISAEIDAVSQIRPAHTIGEAKRLPAGECALITDALVTAVFDGEFFIESSDRSAALRVLSSGSVQPGDRLTITGHPTGINGRATLPDAMFTVTSSATPIPAPVAMPVRSLKSSLAYGLRVTTWGRVAEEGDGYYCVIADGNATAKVTWSNYVYLPVGSYVAVTGVCDLEDENPLVRLSDPQIDLRLFDR